MVTEPEDFPEGLEQTEPGCSTDLELAVQDHAEVEPRCRTTWLDLRWWRSPRRWSPPMEEAYVDFKYQALHVPHFLASLAVLVFTALFAVLTSLH